MKEFVRVKRGSKNEERGIIVQQKLIFKRGSVVPDR